MEEVSRKPLGRTFKEFKLIVRVEASPLAGVFFPKSKFAIGIPPGMSNKFIPVMG